MPVDIIILHMCTILKIIKILSLVSLVKALYAELEGSWFKLHYASGRTYFIVSGPMLAMGQQNG